LSVQVHPGDDFARAYENSLGKTEMWHVSAAEPDARIAIGFREPVTREQVRAAAISGEIENLLQWFDARAGDTFFIPAGTVHAIGPGLTICEIQQRSNIVYRLYDYGRLDHGKPRELHLDQALAVSTLLPHSARSTLPVRCEYFVTELVKPGDNPAPSGRPEIWAGIQGEHAGKAFLRRVQSSPEDIAIMSRTEFLRTYIP